MIMKEIKGIDFDNNEITIETNKGYEIIKMSLVGSGFPTEIKYLKENPEIEIFIFLYCNIENQLHFGVTIKEIQGMKAYLIKSDLVK